MLTVGGLFSGIGGIELGLQRAGMQIRWMVEIDPFCQKILAKHWPNVRRYGDVRDCGKHNLEPVDLIAGGFPCQPHSVAGKQRGAKDDRDLWPEYRRIIAELRPHWVLAENVLGIRTTMLDQVLSDLESLAYTTGTLVVPACAFDAPHRRERVFIIAYTESDLWRTSRDDRSITFDGSGSSVADAKSERKATAQQSGQLCRIKQSRQDVAHTTSQQRDGSDDNRKCRSQQISEFRNGIEEIRPLGSRWSIEPNVGRVAHGIPNRVDRLRALGNAVVPQVAEWIGRQILDSAGRKQK